MQALQPAIHVGIDVSKAHLDIDIYPDAAPKRYANDEAGRLGRVRAFTNLSARLDRG